MIRVLRNQASVSSRLGTDSSGPPLHSNGPLRPALVLHSTDSTRIPSLSRFPFLRPAPRVVILFIKLINTKSLQDPSGSTEALFEKCSSYDGLNCVGQNFQSQALRSGSRLFCQSTKRLICITDSLRRCGTVGWWSWTSIGISIAKSGQWFGGHIRSARATISE